MRKFLFAWKCPCATHAYILLIRYRGYSLESENWRLSEILWGASQVFSAGAPPLRASPGHLRKCRTHRISPIWTIRRNDGKCGVDCTPSSSQNPQLRDTAARPAL